MVPEAPKARERRIIREYLRRGYRSLIPLLYARTNFKLFVIDCGEALVSLRNEESRRASMVFGIEPP